MFIKNRQFCAISLFLLLCLIRAALISGRNSDGALWEYFGGKNLVPPLVDGITYGGETEMVFALGDHVILDCAADYPINWTAGSEDARQPFALTMWEEPSNKTSEPTYFATMTIQNLTSDLDKLKAICYAENGNQSTTIIIRISKWIDGQISDNTDTDIDKNCPYLLRSSMSKIVITDYIDFVYFWVDIRPPQSALSSLPSTNFSYWYYRSFHSPYESKNNGLVKKLEESGTIAKPINASDFRITLKIDLRNPFYVPSGEFSLIVKVAPTMKLICEKSFQLQVIANAKIDGIKLYALPANQSITPEYLGFIVNRPQIESVTNVKLQDDYLFVCVFSGNQLLDRYASMFRQKYGYPNNVTICAPMPLELPQRTNYSDPKNRYYQNKLYPVSCYNYTNQKLFSDPTYLQRFYGTNTIAIAAIMTVKSFHMTGCMYNGPYNNVKFTSRELIATDIKKETNEYRVDVQIIQPHIDQIIPGDTVIMSCTVNKRRYKYAYWEINNGSYSFINDGDLIGTGYKLDFSTTSVSRVYTLTIFNISTDQSAIYRCRGQPSMPYFPDVYSNVTVLVREPISPYFGPKTSDQFVKVTTDVAPIELYCDARGSPKPEIEWHWATECNGQNISCPDQKNEKPTVSSDGLALKIPTYDSRFSGQYSCTIKNRLNSTTYSMMVQIDKPQDQLVPILIGVAVLIAVAAVLFAVLAVRFYRRSRDKARVKVRLARLREEVDTGELDPNKPSNAQPEKLPFEPRYEITRNNLTILFDRLLGAGANGKVCDGYMKLDDGLKLKVAIKEPIKKTDLNQIERLVTEVKLMMHIGWHENIVALLGVCMDDTLYVVLEYCEYKSLHDFLQFRTYFRSKYETVQRACKLAVPDILPTHYVRSADVTEQLLQISELDLVWYAYQIARGMAFLADKKLVHCDLALRNMLCTKEGIIKTADFGLSLQKLVDEHQQDNNITKKDEHADQYLPIFWMSIEAITERLYTVQSDVGALMQQCWLQDPDQRPSFNECRDTLSNIGKSMSPIQWEKLHERLDTSSEYLKVSNYYNLNQIVSLKRGVEKLTFNVL